MIWKYGTSTDSSYSFVYLGIEKTKKRLTACKAKQAALGEGRKKPVSALALAKQRSLGAGGDSGTVLAPVLSNGNSANGNGIGTQLRTSPAEAQALPSTRR